MYYKDITLTGPQAAIGYEDENLPTRVIIAMMDAQIKEDLSTR